MNMQTMLTVDQMGSTNTVQGGKKHKDQQH